jgi:hypothetical protein
MSWTPLDAVPVISCVGGVKAFAPIASPIGGRVNGNFKGCPCGSGKPRSQCCPKYAGTTRLGRPARGPIIDVERNARLRQKILAMWTGRRKSLHAFAVAIWPERPVDYYLAARNLWWFAKFLEQDEDERADRFYARLPKWARWKRPIRLHKLVAEGKQLRKYPPRRKKT